MKNDQDGYCLVRDDDTHWYVIPSDKKSNWENIWEIHYTDDEFPDIPFWADRVGGSPSLVIFRDYEIK